MRHQQTPWRRDQKILDRMAKVDELHLMGWSTYRIGAELGISHATVSLDMKRNDELYRERKGETIEANRDMAIRRIEMIGRRALEWASVDHAREHAVLFNEPWKDEDGKEHRVSHDDKGSAQYRSNKAALVSTAEKCAMDIAKLQGIVVEKAALTDADGKSLAELILKARADGSGS